MDAGTSLPEALSLAQARRILLGTYCVVPIGNKVLHKWYGDAKNWQGGSRTGSMSPRKLLGHEYPEPALFRDLARQIIGKCEMIARAQHPGRKHFESYIKNAKDDLVDIAFMTPMANPIIVPKDRLLLALGEYLLGQKKAIDKEYHPFLAGIKPVLERMKDFADKPVHRLEIAYIAAIATAPLSRAPQPIRAVSALEKKSIETGFTDLGLSRTGPAVKKVQARPQAPETLLGMFKVDWSNHPLSRSSKLGPGQKRAPKINPSQPTN